jgi:4-carboxymuconolactone decarboxylase
MTTPKSTAMQTIGDIAPKLADLTENVLFGDVWERAGLSKRDRSLVTVAALVALYRTKQLGFHLQSATQP